MLKKILICVLMVLVVAAAVIPVVALRDNITKIEMNTGNKSDVPGVSDSEDEEPKETYTATILSSDDWGYWGGELKIRIGEKEESPSQDGNENWYNVPIQIKEITFVSNDDVDVGVSAVSLSRGVFDLVIVPYGKTVTVTLTEDIVILGSYSL